jgi:hypothetical protein
MIPLYALFPAMVLLAPPPVRGNTISSAIETALRRFETAYVERNLSSFSNPDGKPFKVSIVHSIIEFPEGEQSRKFDSFKEFETWLRSKEHGVQGPNEDLLPVREVRSRKLVRPGVIEYENMGISHNHLYLSKIRFTQKGRSFSVVEIVLYDGD